MIGPLALLLPLVSAAPVTVPARLQEPVPTVVYAPLPVRNLTGRPGAADYLMRMVQTSLEARGARFVPADDMESFLRARRIRYTDSLSVSAATALAAETGADYVLAGALLRYETGAFPHVALGLRLLDTRTGTRFQSVLVNLSGDDFMGLLGLGAITDVTELELEVLVRVLAGFDEDGSPLPGLPGGERQKPSRARGVRAWFMSEDFDPSALERIIVMPLVNRTRHLGAGRQFAAVLGHEWFTLGGVEVAEPSELRAALIQERVRSIQDLDPATLSRIGQLVGARYIVMGSVDNYSEDVVVGPDRFPEIEVSVRVIDSLDGRIVAAVAARRRGDQYHKVLGLGMIEERLELAVRVAQEIVASFGRMS